MSKKCKTGYYYCYTDKKCKKIPMGWHVGRGGIIEKDNEEKTDETKNGNGNPNGGGESAVSEAAVSKAQQRFFGMVRAAQKGEMENPSPEVAKVAATAKRSDVKKFAKTKHKGLPDKKEVSESKQSFTSKEASSKLPKGYSLKQSRNAKGDHVNFEVVDKKGREIDTGVKLGGGRRGKDKYSPSLKKTATKAGNMIKKVHKEVDKIQSEPKKKPSKPKARSSSDAKRIYKSGSSILRKMDRERGVTRKEETRYDRYDSEKKKFEKSDARMKHGKNWKQFTKDAEAAKNRLRKGEVRKFNKQTGKWESNKD